MQVKSTNNKKNESYLKKRMDKEGKIDQNQEKKQLNNHDPQKALLQ